jgi:hypothetical protein
LFLFSERINLFLSLLLLLFVLPPPSVACMAVLGDVTRSFWFARSSFFFTPCPLRRYAPPALFPGARSSLGVLMCAGASECVCKREREKERERERERKRERERGPVAPTPAADYFIKEEILKSNIRYEKQLLLLICCDVS